MLGYGKIGECELGKIEFTNWRSASTLPDKEFLERYADKYYLYDVWFIPPNRKRKIILQFLFNKDGCLTDISINWKHGYFPKYLKNKWIDILKTWLIEQKYAEEVKENNND